MRYIEGFRNPAAAAAIAASIARLGEALDAVGRRASVMEVCGTHTMAIARYGIRDLLPPNVELISGPGCPVCVTASGYVDAAVALARLGIVVATFGDMILVPGSATTLADSRAAGSAVEVCYSPADALDLAATRPEREVVFLAIGFETTIAPIIGTLDAAVRRGIRNFSLLTAFKLVPPALHALLTDPDMHIDALLCPAHVSAVIGADAYRPIAGQYHVPCVIAGFEPLDILLGLQGILEQMTRNEARVDNQYARVVTDAGNLKAQRLFARYLQPQDALWRGLGQLPGSGLELRPEFSAYDAAKRHGIRVLPGKEPAGCLCGDVVKGKAQPPACALFGRLCTPDHAVGPCMISAEGTCAAYFKYIRSGGKAEEAQAL